MAAAGNGSPSFRDWVGIPSRGKRLRARGRGFGQSGALFELLERLARHSDACFTLRVPLPYKIATLLYCFNARDEVLLLERAQEPNRGLWSPGGGKLHTDDGESPYACACREAREEIGLELAPADLQLTGLVSEHGYQGHAHWLMFLFEVKRRLAVLPPVHEEGRFQFFSRAALDGLKLPETDRESIWPWFWQHRGGFFAAHCHCHPDGRNVWTLEESTGAPNRNS
jgi:8-oxo-dGTP diphosphatase